MRFLDRDEEMAKLRQAFEGDKPAFVVLYGRRRIGKSRLLQQVLGPDDLYFMADRTDQTQQRRLFAHVVSTKFPNFDRMVFPDWESLWEELSHRAQPGKRFVVCLDEFPYLVQSCPALPSVLQKCIDTGKFPFHLVICGSSQHLMQDIVLNASEPLYGRATRIMRLRPLAVRYLPEVLAEPADMIVDEYAVWGGVPRYWELRENEPGLLDAVMHLVADTDGVLYDEPGRLLADDLEQTALASAILSLVGDGANRMSEIAARLGRKSTDISMPVRKLMDLGYLEREIPFGTNPSDTKRTLYRISDEFLAFHYRFIVPLRSLIGLGRGNLVRTFIADNFPDFAAKEWERLCRKAVSGNTLFGITWNVAGRWWGTIGKKQREFDLVAESIDRKSLLIGECKWTKAQAAEPLLSDLRRRAEGFPLAAGRKVFYALFLRHEPTDGGKPYVVLPERVIRDFQDSPSA